VEHVACQNSNSSRTNKVTIHFFEPDSDCSALYVCDQLQAITDRMVKSMDFDISRFFSEIDRSLEASRRVFRRLDSVLTSLTEADWLRIEAKVSWLVFSALTTCAVDQGWTRVQGHIKEKRHLETT